MEEEEEVERTVDEWMGRTAKRMGSGFGNEGSRPRRTASSLCENAVTLGRHFLSSVAPGTMGRAAFCRGNEGGMGAGMEVWKERREEKERVEMEEKRRLKFLRYATVILSWILLDEI